ncbi:MAG: hypothetical protein ACOCX4_07460 [Planctomycetota bacterium]
MKAPYRLLYNNDTTNTAGIVSPWHEEGEPFREELLVASIAEVAGAGVDAYMLSPGMGWVPWWQSQVDPGFYDWWRERTGLEVEGWGNPPNGYDRYVADGGDMVQVLVDTCRRHDMAPFVSLRMNDVHHQEHYDRKSQRSLVSCRLYAEHPEWHLDRDHPQREGYDKRRGMNWAIPEVREYKLALLRELASKYELAGLELDFLRDETLFRDEVPMEERVAIITDFVSRVRQALDAGAQPGRHLCVRIPLASGSHAAVGLDAARLAAAGVDMFNLSGWYHTTQGFDITEVRRQAPDAAVYVELTHSTGFHPHFLGHQNYGTNGDPRTSDHQYYTTAEQAHAQGADGLSLFNFVYYRMGHQYDIPVMEPPFHVLPKLNDVAFLQRQEKYYMLAGTYYHRQLPRRLARGEQASFRMQMLAPRGSGSEGADGRLRLHLREPHADPGSLTVAVNGQKLTPSDDVSRFHGNPFDRMISPLANRAAYGLPINRCREGDNEITVDAGRGEMEVVYLDASLPA